MLPGFNHNIRYKDRVFHVQTEDNGLKQPRLITQVFVDGHILAIEKSEYADILARCGDDEENRDQQIRVKMQDQHKQLLKNLVAGAYDDKIEIYLGGEPTIIPHHPDVPTRAIQEAEALPSAPMHPEGLTQELEAIIIEAPEEISPESLLDPDFLEEIGAAVEAETRRDAPERPPTPISSLSGSPLADPDQTGDFLDVLDQEMKKQLPFEPRKRPPDDEAPTTRPQRVVGRPLHPPRRRNEPTSADTVVDFGLPAALRDTLERPGPKPSPRSDNETLLDMELRNVAAKLRPVQMRIDDDTALETDAAELQRDVAAQRNRLRAPEDTPTEEEVVVSERSLDEVILSYLSDDPEQ
ncbi:MAG: hypothetical protein RMA76_19395 [Deltaproteobacteria bacterium]|jgi:hypothetical protein